MSQIVVSTLQNETLIITINRQDKLNALNREVIDALSVAIDEVYQNPMVKSAIITGAGPKAFVAGADISEFEQLDNASGTALATRGQEKVFNKIENCPKPVIAAVNGFALGGGCELAMACHLRLASDNARFGQPEVNLGLVPGYGGTQRLVHLVGKGKAMELLLTGQMLPAAEALQWGLVNKVTSQEELLPACFELLETIQSKAPLAVAACIQLVNTATYEPHTGLAKEIEAFGTMSGSADVREGTAAFLEKRKPRFTGK